MIIGVLYDKGTACFWCHFVLTLCIISYKWLNLEYHWAEMCAVFEVVSPTTFVSLLKLPSILHLLRYDLHTCSMLFLKVCKRYLALFCQKVTYYKSFYTRVDHTRLDRCIESANILLL